MLRITAKVGPKTDKYAHMRNQEPPLCKCGCGGRTKWCKTRKVFCQFINGHNSKLNPMNAQVPKGFNPK